MMLLNSFPQKHLLPLLKLKLKNSINPNDSINLFKNHHHQYNNHSHHTYMWYVKKAAKGISKLSEKIMPNNSRKQKLQSEIIIAEIIKNKSEVMATNKMAKIAELSFQMDQFEAIIILIKQKLQDYRFNAQKEKKFLNILVLVSYLIKHGAGGFIDEFRGCIDAFAVVSKYYQTAAQKGQNKVKNSKIVREIDQRIKYICELLTNKEKLIKEKEIAMLVKQRIKMNPSLNIENQSNNCKDENEKKTALQKIDGFLQHYVWRYTNKMEQKLDNIADKIILKIDQYLNYEIPEDFQIDQLIEEHQKQPTKTQIQIISNETVKEQIKFIESKVNPLQDIHKNTNLLEIQDKKKEQNLIKFDN